MNLVTKSAFDRIETVARSDRDEGHVKILAPLVSLCCLIWTLGALNSRIGLQSSEEIIVRLTDNTAQSKAIHAKVLEILATANISEVSER